MLERVVIQQQDCRSFGDNRDQRVKFFVDLVDDVILLGCCDMARPYQLDNGAIQRQVLFFIQVDGELQRCRRRAKKNATEDGANYLRWCNLPTGRRKRAQIVESLHWIKSRFRRLSSRRCNLEVDYPERRFQKLRGGRLLIS